MKFKILISPTAFKGTLSPWRAARLIARAFRASLARSQPTLLPLADGGDGTLEVLMRAMKGRLVTTTVEGPLRQRVRASWALCRDKTAVIEMARASGLALLKGRNRILDATSAGTGELIEAALNRGCRRILIGVGGTASSDGGAGALRALGLRYFDARGKLLDGSPREMAALSRVDWTGLDPRLRKARIDVLCDVTNPLLGSRGSAAVFGPQKGAAPRDVVFLERTLRRWSRFARYKAEDRPGAGAAGALAFGLSGFLGARLVSGTPFVMKTIRWPQAARRARLIVTGEGRIDKTSFGGKVLGEIARATRGRSKVVAVCGDSPLRGVYLRRHGILHTERLGPAGRRHPERELLAASKRLCAFLSSLPPAANR